MVTGRTRTRFLWVLNQSLNRATTRLALRGIGPFSLIQHVGRKSGRPYQTPVILARTADGFVAELTYGPTVDWYRNISAAGCCNVVYRGKQFPISAIEPLPAADGLAAYPQPARFVLRALRRHDYRLLRLDVATERDGAGFP